MRKAILAGVLIGIGDIAMMEIDNPYISALVFAVALLAIINLKLPLFTGRVGNLIHTHSYLGCIVLLIFNALGVFTAMILYMGMNQDNYYKIMSVADAKFTNVLHLFFAGVLCNILIHVAVTCKREVITVLCIMAFILCGFEHSIADAGYALVSLDIRNIGLWLVVVLGNSIGGILTEYCFTERMVTN